MSTPGDELVCADCGKHIPWRSDEAGEWPAVTDRGSFKTVCLDCYRRRYGADEADQRRLATRLDQADERGPAVDM
jgi:hypothetical protein